MKLFAGEIIKTNFKSIQHLLHKKFYNFSYEILQTRSGMKYGAAAEGGVTGPHQHYPSVTGASLSAYRKHGCEGD